MGFLGILGINLDTATNGLVFIAAMCYIACLGFLCRADRLAKMSGENSIKLKGVFKFIIIHARKIAIITNEHSSITDEYNLEWKKCNDFKNSVTKSVLIWQMIHHVYFWGVIMMSMWLELNRFDVIMFAELILSGAYLPFMIIYAARLSKKEVRIKDKLLASQIEKKVFEINESTHDIVETYAVEEVENAEENL